MELLPAIDLRHGRVVRLLRGDDARRTVYSDRPLAVLEGLVGAGVRRIHVVDLDAAFDEDPQRELVAELAARLAGKGADLQLGGGLRDGARVAWALEEAGCGRAVVGSMLARDFRGFARLARRYPGRLVPALDVEDGEVRVAGWTEGAGRSLDALCEALRGLPCPAVLVTDVARDGTLEGPNFELSRRVAELSGVPAILSGGVRCLSDIERARGTREIGAAIVGRALYESAFGIEEALAAAEGPPTPAQGPPR